MKDAANRIDPYQALGFAEIDLAQRGADRLAGGGLAADRHAVLDVHDDAVHAERRAFFDLVAVVTGHE